MKSLLNKILLILSTTIFLFSCVNNSHKENAVQPKGMIMSSKIDKLITSQAQVSVFEIVDYFSVNYPYSTSQIEKHFNTSFTVESRESAWFDVVLLYPRDGDTTNISEMEIRSSDRGTQFFHVKLKEPVCFAGNKFREKMKQDDYVLIARLGSLSFDRVMDKDRNFGKMELFFEPIDIDNEEICIKTINFSTSKTFDRSKYE